MLETNQQTITKLLNRFREHTLHHAILFVGKQGIGKANLIKALVKEIIKSSNSTVDVDHQINMANTFSHPDIFQIGNRNPTEESAVLAVSEAREISNFVQKTSSILDAKIVIIDCIDNMNNASCNSILKTLEEPTERTFFFIVCHNTANTMPTILSRCYKIVISPPNPEESVLTIMHELPQISKKEAIEYVAISDNSPGNAKFLFQVEAMQIYVQFLSDLVNRTSLSATITDKMSVANRAKMLNIFANRAYQIIVAVALEKQDLSLTSVEQEFLGQVKKSNLIAPILQNFSEASKTIQNIITLNNHPSCSWIRVVQLMSL